MGKLRYHVTYEVDKDFLCDESTLKTDFNNNWQEFLDWFYKEEPAEVMMGLGTKLVEFKAEAQDDK